jgi:membrane-associated protease RseP (regulator of RpoE activity)
MAFAAWFGLLATALNLFPIGQFDGGHIAYAAFGRRSLHVTIGTIAVAVGLCFYSSSWIVWTGLAIALLSFFGWRHPPTWDDHVPLDRTRMWLALLALIVFVVCFTPAPIEPLDLVRPQ